MDIYFEEQYAKLYENENEKIEVFEYKNELGRGRNIFLKRKIFSQNLKEQFFDIITPYGYGGPIFEVNDEDKEKFIEEYFIEFSKYCEKNNIVSEFIRFHPLLKNHKGLDNKYEIINISNTIYIELNSLEDLNRNLGSQAKRNIKTALKNNILFKEDDSLESKNIFKKLYYETMKKNNAKEMYYFSDKYFEEIFKMKEKIKLFVAKEKEQIVSVFLIFLGDKIMHYHLAGNSEAGYKVGASHYLFYEISKWGIEKGYNKFHLGGGYGGDDSPLFKFKKSMNKNGVIPFYIGKKIWNKKIYKKLVEEIELTDIERESSYFPLYRIRV